MLPTGAAPRARGSRRRGGTRSSTTPSDTQRKDPRRVHFAPNAQSDGTLPQPGPARGRGARGTARGTTPGTSRAASAAGRGARRGGALAQANNHMRGGAQLTSAAQGTPQERYDKLRKRREPERAAAIAQGKMADPERKTTLAEAITRVGECRDMCPEYERLRRIVENDVWPEEKEDAPAEPGSMRRNPDEGRMVKRFQRSSAGMEEQLPSDLRPPRVLQQTLDYLFNTVIGNAESLASVHHFVWDRTRAVRNDFSIQQVTKEEDVRVAVDCYERIVRFHILSLHLLALPEQPYPEYSAQQDGEQLTKALLSLTQYYEDNRGRFQFPNEAEFRAYSIIYELRTGTPDLEDRIQTWPREIMRHPRVQRALKLYASICNTHDPHGPMQPPVPHPIAQANWARYWALVDSGEFSYLMACIAEQDAPTVRRIALNNIWTAYRVRNRHEVNTEWSLDELRGVFGFETEDQVQEYCQKFGFNVVEKEDGTACLDLGSVTEMQDMHVRQYCTDLVEHKRQGRTYSAVISGMTVRQAKEAGMVEEAPEMEMDGAASDNNARGSNNSASSLFVTDEDSDNDGQSKKKTTSAPETTKATPALNPFASSFTPLPSTPEPQKQTWSTNTPIKFGSSPDTNQNKTWSPAQGITFGSSPAAKAETKSIFDSQPPATSSPLLSSTTPPAQVTKPYDSTSNSVFKFGAPSNAQTPPSTQQESPFAGFKPPPSSFAPKTPSPSNPFTTQPPAPQNQQQIPNQPASTSTPFQPFPNPPSSSNPPSDQQQSQQAAEQEAQRKAQEKRLAQEAEARQRAAEQQARRVAEARRAEEQRRADVQRENERRAAEQASQRLAAERQNRKSKVVDDLARRLLLEPGGFFDQFVEFTAKPMVEKAQIRLHNERVRAKSNLLYGAILMRYYGRKWREISWKQRLARQARERRKRRTRHVQARARTTESDASMIAAEMEDWRRSQSDSGSASLSSQHASPSAAEPFSASKQVSAPSPLQSSIIDFNPTPAVLKTTTGMELSEEEHRLKSLEEPSFRRSIFDSPDYGRRTDTTRSTYFRLKAMGLDPNSPTLFSSTAVPPAHLRKRSRDITSELDDLVPRKRSNTTAQAGDHDLSMQSTHPHIWEMPPPSKPSPNAKSTTAADKHNEDEELFAAARQIRETMSESITFFKEEIAKSSRETSVQGSPPPTLCNGTSSHHANGLSSRRDKEPPPKYRSRVSKFLPRERYADVLMQQQRAAAPNRPPHVNGVQQSKLSAAAASTPNGLHSPQPRKPLLTAPPSSMATSYVKARYGPDGLLDMSDGDDDASAAPGVPASTASTQQQQQKHAPTVRATNSTPAAPDTAARSSQTRPISPPALHREPSDAMSAAKPAPRRGHQPPPRRDPSANAFALLGNESDDDDTQSDEQRQDDDDDESVGFSSGGDGDEQEEDDEEEEEEEEEEQPSGVINPAWSGKTGASVEDAIEL